MKKLYVAILVVILALTAGFYYLRTNKEIPSNTNNPTPTPNPTVVLSFEDCVKAGYSVMESSPRQCKTPDGRTYAEEIPEKITYNNATADLIKVDLPFPGAVTGKEFSITGQARGTWYFEASFPVKVLDKDGKVLFQGPAQAQGDWMTQNFVPFKINVKVPQTYMGKATIVLMNDNPSGMPENEKSISFPITIEY